MPSATSRPLARLGLAVAVVVATGALGILPAAPAGASQNATTTVSLGTQTDAGRPITVNGAGFKKTAPGVDVSLREYDEGDPAYAGGPAWAEGPTNWVSDNAADVGPAPQNGASASINDDGTFETSLLLTPTMLAALDPSKEYSVVTRTSNDMGQLPSNADQISETPIDASQLKAPTTLTATGGTYDHRGTAEVLVDVIGYRGQVTGTVAVKEGSTTVATSTITPGYVSSVSVNLPAGIHALTVEYAGDPTYWPSAGSTTVEIRKWSSDVVLTTPRSTSYGHTRSVTVSVPKVFAVGNATGTVTLTGAGTPRTGTLKSGKVNFAFPASQPAGTYRLKATYAGDDNYEQATGTRELVVYRADPKIKVAVKPQPTAKKRGKATVTGIPRSKITVTVTRGEMQQPVLRVTIRLNRAGKGFVSLPKAPGGGKFEVGAFFSAAGNYDNSTDWAHYTVKK